MSLRQVPTPWAPGTHTHHVVDPEDVDSIFSRGYSYDPAIYEDYEPHDFDYEDADEDQIPGPIEEDREWDPYPQFRYASARIQARLMEMEDAMEQEREQEQEQEQEEREVEREQETHEEEAQADISYTSVASSCSAFSEVQAFVLSVARPASPHRDGRESLDRIESPPIEVKCQERRIRRLTPPVTPILGDNLSPFHLTPVRYEPVVALPSPRPSVTSWAATPPLSISSSCSGFEDIDIGQTPDRRMCEDTNSVRPCKSPPTDDPVATHVLLERPRPFTRIWQWLRNKLAA